MQLRNGTKYSNVTVHEFNDGIKSIMAKSDVKINTIYKLFKHINSEYPEMYHKMNDGSPYNKGRNLNVVNAYQKSSELIASLLKQAYSQDEIIDDLRKNQIVKTLYELNQTKMIMRRLIWGTIIQDKHVKSAMGNLSTDEIDESKFETKLYRCLMHMYDIDSNNAAASYGWFGKYKKNGENDEKNYYSNIEIYDYYYSGDGYAEDDTYITSYEKCFVYPIESLNSLYWL